MRIGQGTVAAGMDEQAGAALVAALGPGVVINLAERADRRAEMAGELARLGLALDVPAVDGPAVRLFAAVRPAEAGGFPTIGTRGCFLSHLGVLRLAREAGWDRVMILEDDLDFVPDIAGRLPAVLSALEGQDWSLFYGGYGEVPAGDRLAGGLVRLDPAAGVRCTHFMAVRGPAIGELVGYLEAMLARPAGSPEGGPMHVDGAYSWYRAAHPHRLTLAAVPPLGVQRPSPTDILGRPWFDRVQVLAPVVRLARSVKRRMRG
jgi:glycosyl transferase family 25